MCFWVIHFPHPHGRDRPTALKQINSHVTRLLAYWLPRFKHPGRMEKVASEINTHFAWCMKGNQELVCHEVLITKPSFFTMVEVTDIDTGFIQKLELQSSAPLYLSFGNYFPNMRMHIGENIRTVILRSYLTLSSPLRNHENHTHFISVRSHQQRISIALELGCQCKIKNFQSFDLTTTLTEQVIKVNWTARNVQGIWPELAIFVNSQTATYSLLVFKSTNVKEIRLVPLWLAQSLRKLFLKIETTTYSLHKNGSFSECQVVENKTWIYLACSIPSSLNRTGEKPPDPGAL